MNSTIGFLFKRNLVFKKVRLIYSNSMNSGYLVKISLFALDTILFVDWKILIGSLFLVIIKTNRLKLKHRNLKNKSNNISEIEYTFCSARKTIKYLTRLHTSRYEIQGTYLIDIIQWILILNYFTYRWLKSIRCWLYCFLGGQVQTWNFIDQFKFVILIQATKFFFFFINFFLSENKTKILT